MAFDMDNEWLKNLKVGDEVFVVGRWGKSLSKVQRITPTGRIVVNNIQYNATGKARTGDIWATLNLERVTEESVARYKKAKFVSAVRAAVAANLTGMSYNAAKQINEILKLGIKDTLEDDE